MNHNLYTISIDGKIYQEFGWIRASTEVQERSWLFLEIVRSSDWKSNPRRVNISNWSLWRRTLLQGVNHDPEFRQLIWFWSWALPAKSYFNSPTLSRQAGCVSPYRTFWYKSNEVSKCANWRRLRPATILHTTLPPCLSLLHPKVTNPSLSYAAPSPNHALHQ